MEINCAIQNYDWGKKGSESLVAKLYANSNKDFKIECSRPYAELWMGTHVNGPSTLKKDGTPLQKVIEQNPEFLGEASLSKFGIALPFLFKVLSVNQALSIQAHPAKKHAEELHKNRPDLYKDPNHKPELAIAITPFEALCGFRQLDEIKNFLTEIPELSEVIGLEIMKDLINGKTCDFGKAYKALMTCSPEIIKEQLEKLVHRLGCSDDTKRKKLLAPLLERLNKEYPGDVGCFSIYFLNYLTLEPMQALYLGPNEPHAYLYGDCIECMACSDNVVRAGLTPKFKDVETLCSMLNYKGEAPEAKLFKPVREDEFTEVYKPPVPDFSVAKIDVPCTLTHKIGPRQSASILLCVEGTGNLSCLEIKPGSVVFIPAELSFELQAESKLLCFQAMANL